MVNKMVKVMGAPIKQEDIPKIVDYLMKYYGKKNNNGCGTRTEDETPVLG